MDKPKCPLCGRLFKSVKALNTHLAKAHKGEAPPLIYANEGMQVKNEGAFTRLDIRIRRSLWKDIENAAQNNKVTVEELVFNTLTKLGAFGKEWVKWNEKLLKEPTYVT
jgi:hypothetical protein